MLTARSTTCCDSNNVDEDCDFPESKSAISSLNFTLPLRVEKLIIALWAVVNIQDFDFENSTLLLFSQSFSNTSCTISFASSSFLRKRIAYPYRFPDCSFTTILYSFLFKPFQISTVKTIVDPILLHQHNFIYTLLIQI